MFATRRAGSRVRGVFQGIVDHIRCLSILGGAGMGSRVELFAAIRWDYQREGLGVRALARKYDVHRRTVRQAIGSPLPPDRKRAIQQRLGVLKNMPESARNQHLSDPNFTRGMSEEDRATLRDLSHLHVGGAPEPPSE